MARLNFELAKREILDDLFSREPEDWVQASKREPWIPPPGGVASGGDGMMPSA